MKSSDTHWTAIAGFWLAIVGIIVSVIIGYLELKKDDRSPRRGKGQAVERGASRGQPQEEAPEEQPVPVAPPVE